MTETTNHIEGQSRFWDRESPSFDAVYSGEKSLLLRILDRVFRRDMYQRFEFSMHHSAPARGRRFLDIGCGTGRYSIELARQGAAEVIGIDVSTEMIRMAQVAARAQGVEDRCRFVLGEAQQYEGEPTDVTLAIGLFDYVEDPVGLLQELRPLTRSKLIASFPRVNTWRAPLRKIRLAAKGCPVYFFSEARVRRIFDDAGYHVEHLQQVGKLYCVVAVPEDA